MEDFVLSDTDLIPVVLVKTEVSPSLPAQLFMVEPANSIGPVRLYYMCTNQSKDIVIWKSVLNYQEHIDKIKNAMLSAKALQDYNIMSSDTIHLITLNGNSFDISFSSSGILNKTGLTPVNLLAEIRRRASKVAIIMPICSRRTRATGDSVGQYEADVRLKMIDIFPCLAPMKSMHIAEIDVRWYVLVDFYNREGPPVSSVQPLAHSVTFKHDGPAAVITHKCHDELKSDSYSHTVKLAFPDMHFTKFDIAQFTISSEHINYKCANIQNVLLVLHKP